MIPAMSPSFSARPLLRMLLIAMMLIAIAGVAPRQAAAAPTQTLLEFSGGAGGIADSGFTSVLAGANAASTGNLSLGGGALTIAATAGDLPPAGTGQDNALGIQYTSSGSYTIGARLLKSTFAGAFRSAGIYIGKSATQYVRFSARSGADERLQLDVLDNNGKLRSLIIPLPAGTFASIQTSLDLFLSIDHSSNRLTALYRIDSDDMNLGQLATTRNFPRWLRQGNNVAVYAGVLANSSTTATTPVAFDWFRLTLAPQIVAIVTGSKSVDKDGTNAPVLPGDTLTYTIGVKNNGTVTNVQVVDAIPIDTTYVAGSATGGATFDAANNRVVWQNNALGATATASFTFKVKINAPPLQSASVVNTALLTWGTGTIPSLLSAATTVSSTPDLSNSAYVATPAVVGPNGTLTFTLGLLNDGTTTATSPSALLIVPAGTLLLPNSASASAGSLSIDPSLTMLTWSAGTLAADSPVSITFSVKVGSGLANGTPIGSTAVVQAAGILPTLLDAQAVYGVASTLMASKTVSLAVADPGAQLTYSISVGNSGLAASGLRVTDTLSLDTTYLGGVSTTPGAPAPTYNAGTRQLIWPIGALGASQTYTMSFKAQINALPLRGASVDNQALLTAPGKPATLMSASTLVRGLADLRRSLYTAGPATVGAGGTITYTLNLLNDGGAAAGGASATLSIPAGSGLVPGSAAASSGSLSVNTNLTQLSWAASGPLPAGGVVQISFRTRLFGVPARPAIISTATMQAAGLLAHSATARAFYSQAAPARFEMYLAVVRK